MEKKYCSACGTIGWHNPCGKDGSNLRCVYCGYPVPTGPRREGATVVHERQVAKAQKERGF